MTVRRIVVHLGIVLRKAVKTRRVGATEPVDRLIGVADDKQAFPLCAPGLQKPVLDVVAVLEFVYQQVGKPTAAGRIGHQIGRGFGPAKSSKSR